MVPNQAGSAHGGRTRATLSASSTARPASSHTGLRSASHDAENLTTLGYHKPSVGDWSLETRPSLLKKTDAPPIPL